MIDVKTLGATLTNGKTILSEISFQLPEGAKLAIIGANGSGKSTLLKSLLGIVPAHYDQYTLDGIAFSTLSLPARAKLMGYISQQQVPEGDITVWEWCELGRYAHQTSSKENECVITQALERTDSLQFAFRSVASLSGGERQRVYMAGALVQETDVIMLDEVNAALDPKHRDVMNQLIAALHDKTIVSITHDLNMLDVYTHLLALKAGKIVAYGARDEILSLTLLEDVFEYQFHTINHEGQMRFF